MSTANVEPARSLRDVERRGTVSESIYSGPSCIVPMADVQHIELWKDGGLVVVTKHTRWDRESDFWANNIFISAADRDGFLRAWCDYRHELEIETLAVMP